MMAQMKKKSSIQVKKKLSKMIKIPKEIIRKTLRINKMEQLKVIKIPINKVKLAAKFFEPSLQVIIRK